MPSRRAAPRPDLGSRAFDHWPGPAATSSPELFRIHGLRSGRQRHLPRVEVIRLDCSPATQDRESMADLDQGNPGWNLRPSMPPQAHRATRMVEVRYATRRVGAPAERKPKTDKALRRQRHRRYRARATPTQEPHSWRGRAYLTEAWARRWHRSRWENLTAETSSGRREITSAFRVRPGGKFHQQIWW